MSSAVHENALIERLAGAFSRSPLQLNALQESDAELIRLPGTDLVLALETDAIVEEIEEGLYADPYLAGWMSVLVNASDLAAVGADPVGILLNETLPREADDRFIARLQEGIRDASDRCGLPVLGGDTNFSSKLQIAAFAVGLIPDGRPLTRRGCRPGDLLFLSGPAGLGNAYAFVRLSGRKGEGPDAVVYLPEPRLREGRSLRSVASSCIDTSDGLIPAIDQLIEVNDIGFRLEAGPEAYLHPLALEVATGAGLPPWIMLAGPHGEFELLFTVPAERERAFLAASEELSWHPIRLGSVVAGRGLELPLNGATVRLDTTGIRNLFTECEGDVQRYVHELIGMHDRTGSLP